MSVRPSQRCTQRRPPTSQATASQAARHQNRNTAGVSDHLKLRRPPFGTHSSAPMTIQGSTRTQKPVAGNWNGNGGRRGGRVIWHQEADSQPKDRLPPSLRSSPLSITDQQGQRQASQKSGADANQDCRHGLGVHSTGTTIGVAAVVFTAVPVLIIYLIFQRQLQGSVSAGTNK